MSTRSTRTDQPGYRRLAAALRSDIKDHAWSDEEPLPTDGELETRFGVSRQTVRRAYLELVNEGLVYRVPGRGTFVTPSHLRYHRSFETIDDLLALSDDTDLEIVQPLTGTYDETAAHQLQLPGRLMYGISFVRRHQGTVFCHTGVHLPPETGQLLEGEEPFLAAASRSTRTVIGALAEKGVQISGAEQSMTAKAADPIDAQRLGCAVGHPLLHVERLYVDVSGQPVEWAVSDFLPEHYTHRLRLGRRPVPAPSPTELQPIQEGSSS